MESTKNYEESYKELTRIKKELSTDKVTIDFTKLDTETAGTIRLLLNDGIATRSSKVSSVITRVN